MITKFLAAAALAMFVALAASGSSIAAESGNVPAEQLAQLGLPQMDVLSDAEGRDIRGSGFFFFGFGHHHFLHGHGHLEYHGPFFFGHHGHGHGHRGHSHNYLTHGVGFHRFLHVIGHGHGGHHHK